MTHRMTHSTYFFREIKMLRINVNTGTKFRRFLHIKTTTAVNAENLAMKDNSNDHWNAANSVENQPLIGRNTHTTFRLVPPEISRIEFVKFQGIKDPTLISVSLIT